VSLKDGGKLPGGLLHLLLMSCLPLRPLCQVSHMDQWRHSEYHAETKTDGSVADVEGQAKVYCLS
jgi:hypothetical protein